MERRRHCLAVLVLMLQAAVCAQLFVSLFVEYGEFVRDEGVVLSPTRLCVAVRDLKPECSVISDLFLVRAALVLCVYGPLALTLFAVLGFLYGVCLPDSPSLSFSLVAQALAAMAMLGGIVTTVAGHWRLVRLPGLTLAFYLSVCACVEMGMAAFLCWVILHRLTSRKELTGSFV